MGISIFGITHEASPYNANVLKQTSSVQTLLRKSGFNSNFEIIESQIGPAEPHNPTCQWNYGSLARTVFAGASMFFRLELLATARNPLYYPRIFLSFAARIMFVSWQGVKKLLSDPKALWKEGELTNKHFRCWEMFIEQTENEWAMVLEDDAKPSHHFPMSVTRALKLVDRNDGVPTYIDLVSHFDYFKSYYHANVYKSVGGPGLNTAPFLANTTAAYLINKQFARELLYQLRLFPQARRISIDWAMGYLQGKSVLLKTFGEYYWDTFPAFLNESLILGKSSLSNFDN